MRNTSRSSVRGYTLTELVIVVTIVALVAAIAVPAATSGPDKELELAAAEFAAAIRFARSESIRTGQPHGFQQNESGERRIRVFRADTATSPWTRVFDVRHPVDKQLYDFDIDDQSLAAATSITRNTVYKGNCELSGAVYFDNHGTPWCAMPETVLLESLTLDLQLGNALRTVVLDGITGRVTVR